MKLIYLLLWISFYVETYSQSAQIVTQSYSNQIKKYKTLTISNRQKSSWAYAAAMMLSWKGKIDISIHNITDHANSKTKRFDYKKRLAEDKGLTYDEIFELARILKWKAYNSGLEYKAIIDIFKSEGIVCCFVVTPNALIKPHAFIIMGISNAGFECWDPWMGTHSWISFRDFDYKYGSIAFREDRVEEFLTYTNR